MKAKPVTTDSSSGPSPISARECTNIGSKRIVWLLVAAAALTACHAQVAMALKGVIIVVIPADGGTTNPSPPGHAFEIGSHPVQAIPAPCYEFVRWDCYNGVTVTDPHSASTTIWVVDHGEIDAVFRRIPYTVTVCIPTSGTVSPSPGAHTYSCGVAVSIKATPDSCYRFKQWNVSGGVTVANSTSASTTMTPNGDGTLCPVFEPYVFTVEVLAQQGGEVVPSGFHEFTCGVPTVVQAYPAPRYRFRNWWADLSVSVSDAFSARTTVRVYGNGDLIAIFEKITVPVPNVVGMAQSQAESAITSGGLVVGTTWWGYSDTVPQGQVISQSPAAGTVVTAGTEVEMTLSQGPGGSETIAVPNVVGMAQTAAQSAITSAGLVVGTVTQASSSTVPQGSVISQAPPAGTSVAKGSGVNLVVSSGPPDPTKVEVPNVVGMAQGTAQAAITSAGLIVGTVTQASSSTVPQGSVISQNPAAGTQVARGSAVNLTVSTGSAPVGPIPGGPVVHWKLDETQGTTALDSTGGHDGTLYGNPTWLPTGGMIGGALSFDGIDDRVNCGSFNPSAATGKLSVCLWAKWNGQPTNWQGLIAKRNGWGEGKTMWSLEAEINTGKLGFFHYTSARFGGDPVLPIGEWVHVAVGFDGTTATMYIDGEPTGSGPFSLPSDAQLPVVFGASVPDGANAFNGALDDIRLYDQGLCQRQVLAVMGGSDIVLPTESKDIGVGKAGSDSYKNGVYTIGANGSNIEAGRDDFRYVCVAVTGDFEISARVLSLQKTSAWSKAGVMVRETLDPSARNAFMCVTPESGEGRFVFQARSGQAGGPSTSLQTTQGQVSFPTNTWVKITRKGKALTGLISQDGLSWQNLPGPYPVAPGGSSNPVTIEMPQTVYVGLAVTANDARSLCKAEFDNVLISLIAGAAVESQDPVAHWTFDESTGRAAADSAGECDGVLLGGPVWQPTGGKVGGALKFDGSNDCVVTEFVLNPADGPFSVFAWVQGGAGGQAIVSQDGSAGGTDWLGASSAGRLTSALCSPALTSSRVITDDQWHEVGLTWDGSSRTLYVDGAVVATDKPAVPVSSTGGLNIGAGKNLDAGTFFSGLIDDVRLYDQAVKP